MELEEAIQDIKRICEYLKESDYMSIDKDTKISLETVLNHLTKQEKMIELMAEELAFGVFKFKSKEQAKQYFEKKAEEETNG